MNSQLSEHFTLDDETISSLPLPLSQKDYFDKNFQGKGSFGIRISKGGTRTFFLIFEETPGRKKRVSIGRFPELSLKEARSKAISLLRRTRLSKAIPLTSHKKKTSHQELTLNSVCAKFIHHSKLSGKTEKTLKEYQRILNREVLPFLGDYDIKSLKKHHFLELLEDIFLERGKKALGNRTRSLLHRIFEFSVERELRTTNPLRHIARSTESKKSNLLISIPEIRKLFFHLQAKSSESASAVLFALLTAQPLSVVCNSKWDDFIQGHWALGKDPEDPVFFYLNDLARSLLNIKFETRHKSCYVFSQKTDHPLRYIEKSVRQYGREIDCIAPLNVRTIRESIKHALSENAQFLNPELSKVEIELFLNPLKSKKAKFKKNKIIFHEFGKRAANLLEDIILDQVEERKYDEKDSKQNNNEPTNDPADPFPTSGTNVIFVSTERWKRKK